MKIFSAKEEKPEVLLQCVRELSGKEEPAIVWVDNQRGNYRYWNLYPLYASDGKILHDVILPFDGYRVLIEAGSRIARQPENDEGGICQIDGTVFFRYEGVCDKIKDLHIERDGCLSFSFLCGDIAGWGAGIRFLSSAYDEFSEKTVFCSIFSPAFFPGNPVRFTVSLYPYPSEKNRWELTEELEVLSAFRTPYLLQIPLKLPAGFSFVPACGADANGHTKLYFSPSGTAHIVGDVQLMPGLSGCEILEQGTEIYFVPGQRAYFEEEEPERVPTTSYVSIPSANYYTQPDGMSFYEVSEDGIYPLARLPGVMAGKAQFPVLPFFGLKGNPEEAKRLEENFLCALRRESIEKQIPERRPKETGVCHAVSRSGMYAAYTGGKFVWLQLVPLAEFFPGIGFSSMQDRFWFALMAPKVFVALPSLGGLSEVMYSVTERRLLLAKAHGYRDGEKLGGLLGKTFYSAEEFRQQTEQAGAKWDGGIKEACCHFNQNLAGFEFCCSPDTWEKGKAFFLMKYTDSRNIEEYMALPSLWSLGLGREAVKEVQSRFASVAELAKNPKMQRLSALLTDRGWMGCVCFCAGVDIKALPEELSFLAKGIDADRFEAAFAAFPSVSASPKEAAVSRGSALVFYEGEQKPDFEEFHELGFQVREIFLDIREDKIYGFQVKAELLLNRLFGFPVAGRQEAEEGSSLIFTGSYQKNESGGYYGFALEKPAAFALDSGGIPSVCFERAILKAEREKARFILGGTMQLAGGMEIDLFSCESLPFDGLAIEMEAKEEGYVFHTDYAGFLLHPENGTLRDGSFGKLFPSKLDRMVFSAGRLVTEERFAVLKMKGFCDEVKLGREWAGFVWKIETGNMGGLAAAANLTLELLVAFRPDETDAYGLPAACCGIRIFPAVLEESYALPLQGIMSLGFDSIELIKDEDYYFRFHNFSLTILGKRFPESNNDLYLAGDGEGNLGWYGTAT